MDLFGTLAKRLSEVISSEILTDHHLAPYTAYQIGGPAKIYIAPENEADIGKILEVLNEYEVPLFVMGNGCNLLISDDGWPGVVLHLNEKLAAYEFRGNRASAQAGKNLLDFIQEAITLGLAGMENMAGIPATIGGALRMNAGAFGQEIETTVIEVRGFKYDGQPVKLSRDQINYGYRIAPELEDVVVTSADFEFSSGIVEELTEIMNVTLKKRSDSQPLSLPSCGSVFKRPEGHYAGALIEKAGLKGYRKGNLEVSAKHAGFILNHGGATAQEVVEMIQFVQDKIRNQFGIELETEVKLVGFEEMKHG
jgi:UDP-N-acetylmuramate dehydrogenase